jgi:hypothetical protein
MTEIPKVATSHQPCRCNHPPEWLEREIAAKRWVHEYRDVDGKYALICLSCGGFRCI